MASEENPPLKIAVYGAFGVGKTCLVARFLEKIFLGPDKKQYPKAYRHVEGSDGFPCELEVDGKVYKVLVFDVPNTEQLVHLRQTQLHLADVYVLCASVLNAQSFKSLTETMEYILGVRDKFHSNFPAVIVGTKADEPIGREVSLDDAKKFSESVMDGFEYFETSAATGQNVDAAFAGAVRAALAFKKNPARKRPDHNCGVM